MSTWLDTAPCETEMRHRIDSQPLWLEAFENPKIIRVAVTPNKLKSGSSDDHMNAVEPICKIPYEGRFILPPYRGPRFSSIKPDPSTVHFAHQDDTSQQLGGAHTNAYACTLSSWPLLSQAERAQRSCTAMWVVLMEAPSPGVRIEVESPNRAFDPRAPSAMTDRYTAGNEYYGSRQEHTGPSGIGLPRGVVGLTNLGKGQPSFCRCAWNSTQFTEVPS